MILLDTNIFLELLLDQKRAAECESLLDLISKGRMEATVTHFAVHAVEAALGNRDDLIAFLRNLEHSVGLSVYNTSLSDEMAIALIAQKIGLDFDDALQYYVAKELGVDAIVSFDEHFDRLDIRRLEPRNLLDTVQKKKSRNTS
ncbi:MAG: type II toxin-antitoxin system VapC family toxin [Candidatus Bathyarchaeia archaeon]